MPKRNKVINSISSANSISAIISKFEAKNQLFRVKDDSSNKMSATETALHDDEVFYDDNLFNSSPGNKKMIESHISTNSRDKSAKTLNSRPVPSRGKSLLNLVSWFVFLLSSVNGAIATTLAFIILLPRALIKSLFYPGYRLLFGTLYPAYASYKAVRTKNVKEYVKWMMYWIVFALFSCTETFTDIFLSWFPFYYEIKVILVLWLLSPATKGSSTLYRKFVHPMLTRREQEIDEYISQAKEKGYSAVLQYGSKGVNYATSVIMQTALKGGGNLVSTLRKSYSLSDLSEPDVHRSQDEVDNLTRSQRVLRPRTHSTRSSSSGRNVDMHFSEVDVIDSRPRGAKDDYRSTEDISSGYSSAEPLPGGLSRTASMTNASKIRLRSKKSEDLDSLEFESLISDPLSMHSKILLSRYPMLNEQLQLRHYDDGGEGSEYGRKIKNVSLDENNQRQENKPTALDEIDSAKFAMFCKWLNESNFESTSPDVKSVARNLSIDKESSDDEFVDSTSETVPPNFDKQFKETLPSVIEQANMSSVVYEITQMNEDRPTENTEYVINPVEQCDSVPKIESVETLEKLPSQTNLLELPNQSLLSLNLSCGSSASDLTSENGFPRRRHNKGRAPPIPSTVAHPIADKTVETEPIADKAVEGTPQEKEKKKKNLLTYIPSIFKPVTPSNSSKNLTKETDI